MVTCFAGGILVGLLCGEPILGSVFNDPVRLLIATWLWYITFFAPKDLFHKLTKEQKAIQVPLAAIKGLYYPKKILAGIKHAKYVFKRSPISAMVLATVQANGSGIIKPFARLIRGKWTPEYSELMKPSVTTKYCFLCAMLYVLYPQDITYILIVGLLLAMKVGPIFDLPVDPFVKVEELVSKHVFGSEAKTETKSELKKD